jgi:hypothetical protein
MKDALKIAVVSEKRIDYASSAILTNVDKLKKILEEHISR